MMFDLTVIVSVAIAILIADVAKYIVTNIKIKIT